MLTHELDKLDALLARESLPQPVESDGWLGTIGCEKLVDRALSKDELKARERRWCEAKLAYDAMVPDGFRSKRFKAAESYPGPNLRFGLEKVLEFYHDLPHNGDGSETSYVGGPYPYDYSLQLLSALAALSAAAVHSTRNLKGSVNAPARIAALTVIVARAACLRNDGWPGSLGLEANDAVRQIDAELLGARSDLVRAGRAFSILARDSASSVQPDTREPPRPGLLRTTLESYLEAPKCCAWAMEGT